MEKILDYLSAKEEFSQINSIISNRHTPLLINGISTDSTAFLLNYIHKTQDKNVVFITPSDISSQDIYRELKKYSEKVLILQSDELKFYQIDASNRQNEFSRIRVLRKVYEKDYDFLILTLSSCVRRYMPKKYYEENFIDISLSSKIDLKYLSDVLINLGYERVKKIEGVGQFSLRGFILDVFTPDNSSPVRIEFFDDEVDSIRIFDLYTQISTTKVKKVRIIHAREYLYPKNIKNVVDNLSKQITTDTNDDIRYDIEKIQNNSYFKGLEKYVNFLYPDEDTSIFDIISEDINLVFSEPNRFFEKCDNIFYEFYENYKTAFKRGFALKGQEKIFFDREEILSHISKHNLILTSQFTTNVKKLKPVSIANIDVTPSPKYRGDVENLIVDLKNYQSKDYKVVLCINDENTIKKLLFEFKENEVIVKYIEKKEDIDISSNNIFLIKDGRSQGLIFRNDKFALITENDIFFRISKINSSRKVKSKLKTEKINSFIELKIGDIVVHEVYGIGKFLGIEQKENNSVKKDYIKISYKDGDTIYVPISQMDKVQRYIGNASDKVSLTKLGSSQWKKQKAKAKKAVEEIAKYLVELYAQRENQKGHAFSKDTVWQREFESLFAFEETQDQLRSIKEVKKDMENIKPMDRLLCGDVGYGKTEVAIRGIFKACMDSKQVAFLVPTTILAQQHYKTISERFENFPLKVEVLSRFKTKKEQNEIIEKLKLGEVDVIIGTHRILSKDVVFKDLGLLVIDEEQRFGVKDKEKIKRLKTNIDVLTLTATPIPRTLNMSLSGIRDMSVLEEPPNDRLSVITYVTEAREGIIMDAIEREISRGGQVFFVYNSVEDIDKMSSNIKKLVPNVRLAVAHGQMQATVLEDIMMDYLEKKYDLLLCTTIIETGMDISNANTIIVYNADKMGLSQLYQLRGRVGRSSRQAYAYLMYEKDKVLTEIAQKRLKAIKDFTEFGSGFKVAMMDLELRGSGNLLGETQSGHIEEVGYDLYIKMLNESFNKLKGNIQDEKVMTEVYITVNAYIPDTYIEDEMQKMEIYKKIASISSEEDYFEVQAEIEDRFSDIPPQVENLLKIATIRSYGEKIGIEKITQKNKIVVYESAKDKITQTLRTKDENSILSEILDFMKKIA